MCGCVLGGSGAPKAPPKAKAKAGGHRLRLHATEAKGVVNNGLVHINWHVGHSPCTCQVH